jgi:hypothetical protein
VRKRSARRWTNLGLTPPGKLACYANSGEGSSSAASGRALWRPAPDSSNEEEVPVRNLQLQSGDYVLNDEEEATVVYQLSVISAVEARARFRPEEAEVVRAMREYEAAQKEAAVRSVKKEVIDLDSE